MDGPRQLLNWRTVAVALAVCVLSGGYIVTSEAITPFVDEPATVEVQNADDTTYRVTLSRVPTDSVSDLAFRHETNNRTRYAGLWEVTTSTRFHNLSVVDADRSTAAIVPADGSVSLTLDSFDGGGTYVAIVETADNRAIWTMAEHCTNDGAEFHVDVADQSASVSCV